jgi:hypothetical protein
MVVTSVALGAGRDCISGAVMWEILERAGS